MQLGKLHVVMAHLPIAMVVATALAESLWALTGRKFFENAGLYCLLFALVAAPLTAFLGDQQLDSIQNEGFQKMAQSHQVAGFTTMGLVIAAAAARILRRFFKQKWMAVVYGLVIACMLVAVVIAGHSGGLLSHGQNYFDGLWGSSGGF